MPTVWPNQLVGVSRTKTLVIPHKQGCTTGLEVRRSQWEALVQPVVVEGTWSDQHHMKLFAMNRAVFDRIKMVVLHYHWYILTKPCYRLFIQTLKNHINLWINGHPMTPLTVLGRIKSSAVLPKPVLEDPLPCTFCMSPSSNTPDSTHQLVSRDSKN